MRRARFNLEDQVGGLIDHGSRRERRREAPEQPESEPVDPGRYGLTVQATVAIRAARASDEHTRRRVA
jgi:hypothetical protein